LLYGLSFFCLFILSGPLVYEIVPLTFKVAVPHFG
jgi:hypothetical protein